jgi:isopentenyl-diphosphate Delta-isomerase
VTAGRVFQGPNAHPRLLAELIETRAAVEAAGNLLNTDSAAQIRSLYHFVSRELDPIELPILLSSEYNSAEFLACVDANGEKVLTPPELVMDFQHSASIDPGFLDWFQVELHPIYNQPVLLPARWLCHLIGLRHGTAHLMLTVVDPDERILVQVRSMQKNTSPGRYDLPVAGHVDGLQGYEDTLRKETREEIGLDIDRLTHLRDLGGYLDCNNEGEGFFANCEYHRVFSAALDPALLSTLVPQPCEVASLLLFPPNELQAMRAAFPDFFAPGIQQTFDLFLNAA